MSENGNKNEKTFFFLNFLWDDLLCKAEWKRGVRPGGRPRDSPPSPSPAHLKMSLRFPFDGFKSKIFFQLQITMRSHSTSKPWYPKGKRRASRNAKALAVLRHSVFKTPGFIRFLIRNTCPHQCRLQHSSHAEWIGNVKVISIDWPTSGT